MFIFALIIPLVSGVVLRTGCPLMESSHKLDHRAKFSTVIVSVPFARRHSHFFRDLSSTQRPYCHSVSTSPSGILLRYGSNSDHFCPVIDLVNINQRADDGSSYVLESHVRNTENSSETEEAGQKINETVRIYYVPYGVIIWSCNNLGTNGQFHDEALIVAAHVDTRSHPNSNFSSMVEKMKLATSYNRIMVPLSEYVSWPVNVRDPMSCEVPKLMCYAGAYEPSRLFHYVIFFWAFIQSLLLVDILIIFRRTRQLTDARQNVVREAW